MAKDVKHVTKQVARACNASSQAPVPRLLHDVVDFLVNLLLVNKAVQEYLRVILF